MNTLQDKKQATRLADAVDKWQHLLDEERDAISALLRRWPDGEPFGTVTVRRLSQRFADHHDQYVFYPAGQSPYVDNVDECHVVYTAPPAERIAALESAREVQDAALAVARNDFRELALRAEKLEAALEEARGALDVISSWGEGETVNGAFDEPASATTARAALRAIEEVCK